MAWVRRVLSRKVQRLHREVPLGVLNQLLRHHHLARYLQAQDQMLTVSRVYLKPGHHHEVYLVGERLKLQQGAPGARHLEHRVDYHHEH